jgi:hypothetical protein
VAAVACAARGRLAAEVIYSEAKTWWTGAGDEVTAATTLRSWAAASPD